MSRLEFYALCKNEGMGEATTQAMEAGMYYEVISAWIQRRLL